MLEMVTPFVSIFCTNATLIAIEFYSALISIIEVMISKLHWTGSRIQQGFAAVASNSQFDTLSWFK